MTRNDIQKGGSCDSSAATLSLSDVRFVMSIDYPHCCVFPGRFQPFHNGHAAGLDHAASLYERVIIAISNAHVSHTGGDPFTGGERYEMIDEHVREVSLRDRVHIIPVPVDDEPTTWVATIKTVSPAFDHVYTRSAWTESLFGYWGIPNSPSLISGQLISASDVRARMAAGQDWSPLVPSAVAAVIERCDGVRRVRAFFGGRNHRLSGSADSSALTEERNFGGT
jgi:nicotinamide-nucleotide adenylyltransferase